ncbi:hypothetical protein HPP92_003535 [Vanilla planifolia]|uniref:Uncharacterized protein n=1 Tax=Vanilla planifolia TaxID=51239 RepID=A0A835RVB4_VANPL|nr:hypothetical protein HPP92_003535 [Vanilla planifolia]
MFHQEVRLRENPKGWDGSKDEGRLVGGCSGWSFLTHQGLEEIPLKGKLWGKVKDGHVKQNRRKLPISFGVDVDQVLRIEDNGRINRSTKERSCFDLVVSIYILKYVFAHNDERIGSIKNVLSLLEVKADKGDEYN